MRKVLSVLAVLLIAALICGTVAFAATPRPFTQKGYDINVEYYFVQDDMFMYIHDKDNNLLAVGLDNEGCLVYGEWDLETGGVKQVLDENGDEFVLGVHPAPVSSCVYPIPEIAYKLAEERRIAFDKENEPVEVELPADSITFDEYIAFEAQAKEEGADFSPAYIQEKQTQMKAMSVSNAVEEGGNRDKWDPAVQGYPLHPNLPVIVDDQTNPWPGGTATSPRGGKTQNTWMVYVMFEGASKLKEGAIQLAPSYWNDLMFSDQEWRPYVDERYFSGELAEPDKFSITYALLTGNKLHAPNPATIVVSMDTAVYNTFNAISQDRFAIRDAFLNITSGMPHQEQNLFAFEHGIYHGSTAHALWTASGGRYSLEPAIDDTGKGGILAVTIPEQYNGPIDNANVQGSFGVSGIPTSLTGMRTAAAREAVKKIDMRQFGTYSASNNQWSISQSQVAGGLMMTGYSWEFSAEKCVLGGLPGLWGQSAGGVTVPAADCPPEVYNGASVNISLFVCTTHCLDEGRAGQGTEAVLDYWPTRPRQFTVMAHELSHSTLNITDTYDVGAQQRDLSGASYRYPRYIEENILSNGNIDVVNIPFTGDDAIDPKNWMPGTRYTAAFGNWGIQGVAGYVGSSNEDLAARGGGHDGFNLVDLARVIRPRLLTQSGSYTLKHGDIIQINAGSASPNVGSFTSSGGGHQLFYLSVRGDRGYDQVAFDWARDRMVALSADAGFEGNKKGDNRYSIRSRLARGEPIPAYLNDYRTGNPKENETAFADGTGGLLITHVDTLRAQSSSTGANATAAYGLHVVNVEAHAAPSGIYSLGNEAPKYPDIHEWGNGYYNASADVNLLDGAVASMAGKSASKDSHPATQHMIERYATDRARGQFIGYDVRVNGGDPADLFNQWGVDEFKNPRLFTGESRVSFGNSGNLNPTAVYARSADVRAALERQRRATGTVIPFSITNVRYYHNEGGIDNPTITNPLGQPVSYVTFDFTLTSDPSIVSISLSSTDMVMDVSQTRNLTATLTPTSYPGDRTIVWSSNRTEIATVNSSGVVTTLGIPGFAVITAALSADPTVYATCNVEVNIAPTGVTIVPASVPSLRVGETAVLTATVTPASAVNKTINWSSSNTSVATVVKSGDTQAIVTAVGPGSANITVAPAVGTFGTTQSTYTRAITVVQNVTGVTITPSFVSLLVGGTRALSAEVLPATATNKNVTWTSSTPSVADVSTTGLVTAVTLGTTKITVTTADGGFTADRIVTVINELGNSSLTQSDFDTIHKRVEELSGDVGNVSSPIGVDPDSLIGALLNGAAYDTISRGNGGITPTEYPFPVTSNASNQNEGTRKTAKFTWVEQLSKNLGFPVVVRRQPDKLVYVEIGDPDAPEMIMALSHLDSPPASVSAASHERWRGPDGLIGPASAYYQIAYKTPYVKDGWLYGAGVQDDSGPTLATLLAAKALMDAGLPLDRRIRILMGAYEDGGPGTPSVANTANYMDIPYYTANPGFYDNWAYKYLNREETPIAAYTSDSRFPVIIGNSGSVTPAVSMDLSSDTTEEIRLLSATASITARSGDVTLKDIAYGSTTQIASNAVFTLAVSAAFRPAFIADLNAAAASQGWTTADSATAIANVNIESPGNTVVITINTDVAMEMPTPQYGKNAIVWGMYLLSEAIENAGMTSADLQLKKAADGIVDIFYRASGDKEREAYIGSNIIPNNLLRNPDNGTPNLTLALMGGIGTETPVSFYTASTGVLSIPLYLRYMYTSAADHSAGMTALTTAFTSRGFGIGATGSFSQPTLYMTHDNPLAALQLASYKATMQSDPAAFDDVYQFIDISFAQGTTGGTLASDFRNKMNAFGAIIPGNERWWHTANERISIKSIVQMTKLMADGMLDMARYSGPAGAKVMWADIPGLNPDRADLDLLDVTIGTYKDATGAVPSAFLSTLLSATTFDIPMLRLRGNNGLSFTADTIAAGHASNGIYLPVADIPTGTTHVLPMRLEFKVAKPAYISTADWNAILAGDINDIAPLFTFNILNSGDVIPLTLPAGEKPDMFFFKRVSQYDPNTLYISVNLAIKDDTYAGVETVIADSKTDLYSLNPAYTGADPFPERSVKTQRGFFVFGDSGKNARFTSPTAVFVTYDDIGVSLNESIVTLNVGDAVNLTATVVPDTAPNKNVTWASSNTTVATVLGTGPYAATGIVRAVNPGTATITVTTIDGGKTANCVVTVVQPVTGVTVAPNTASMTVGDTQQLTATVAPTGATDQSITWNSDDPAVATVSATGLITAVSVGTAVITVETVDGGFTDICTVTVTPVPPLPPVPVTGVSVAPTSALLAVNATQQLTPTVAPANATNQNVTWSSSNPTVATVSSAGLVTAASAGTATITVRTADGGFTDTCDITVAAPPAITTATLPSGTEGTAYNQTLTATGNIPITWDVSVGSLPAGLTLNATGVISGTPTSPDTFTFTVRATNVAGTNTRALNIVINPAGTPPTITTATLPSGTVNSAYNQTLVATGDMPITWDISAGSLPTGLTLSPAGAITGTPTAAGTSNFTARATNAEGNDTRALSIVIDAVAGTPPTITTTTLPNGTVGTAFSQTLAATGDAPITWDISAGSLPAGLTLSAAGVISGAPTTAGTFNFTVRATNADGEDTTGLIIVVVDAVIPVDPTYPSDLNDVADRTGIDAGDLEVKDGKVYLKKDAAEKIAKALLHAEDVDTSILPVFEGTVASNGQTAQLSFMMSGKDLLASFAEEINLLGIRLGGAGQSLEYVNDAGDYRDGKFTLRSGGAIYTGEIDPNATYELLVFIKDGGDFDLDGYVNGEYIASIFIASEKTGGSGGGGGGCSTFGYLAFALLAVPFVVRKRQ